MLHYLAYPPPYNIQGFFIFTMIDNIVKLLLSSEQANNELGFQLAIGQNLTNELIAFFQEKIAADDQRAKDLRETSNRSIQCRMQIANIEGTIIYQKTIIRYLKKLQSCEN